MLGWGSYTYSTHNDRITQCATHNLGSLFDCEYICFDVLGVVLCYQYHACAWIPDPTHLFAHWVVAERGICTGWDMFCWLREFYLFKHNLNI